MIILILKEIFNKIIKTVAQESVQQVGYLLVYNWPRFRLQY